MGLRCFAGGLLRLLWLAATVAFLWCGWLCGFCVTGVVCGFLMVAGVVDLGVWGVL